MPRAYFYYLIENNEKVRQPDQTHINFICMEEAFWTLQKKWTWSKF